MAQYKIPELDLVIVDLYPFEETLKNTNEEKAIIEKIDIGGPSMIRAAAKNFRDLVVLSAKDDYEKLNQLLISQDGQTNLEQRKAFAAKAFEVVMHYDIAISNYFNPAQGKVLRYGENPHQVATFYGDLKQWFTQLHGKELSYNNLVDVDAAIALIAELPTISFAIIKHTNVCGVASRNTVFESWQAALAGDPESAFGGVLVTNGKIDTATAEAIQEIFFEVLIAPGFDADALTILSAKKNRVLLQSKPGVTFNPVQKKSILNGNLEQGLDTGNYTQWDEAGARPCSDKEKEDLIFGNIICKHLKSNAIALIKDKQLVGKGCGQTSRVDALRHAIEKAKQFKFDLKGATLASDAFFPFDDCVRIAHAEGIEAYIQPGGSVRDKDSIAYCKENGLAMVMTQLRHFKH
jgi:phosphoribosylaminoimidazolecarboxamide formyltransferase/IMP cyclohydrolase